MGWALLARKVLAYYFCYFFIFHAVLRSRSMATASSAKINSYEDINPHLLGTPDENRKTLARYLLFLFVVHCVVICDG